MEPDIKNAHWGVLTEFWVLKMLLSTFYKITLYSKHSNTRQIHLNTEFLVSGIQIVTRPFCLVESHIL